MKIFCPKCETVKPDVGGPDPVSNILICTACYQEAMRNPPANPPCPRCGYPATGSARKCKCGDELRELYFGIAAKKAEKRLMLKGMYDWVPSKPKKKGKK